MNDKHATFDAEALFARKEQHCGYKYCPLCREELIERELDGHARLVCPNPECGFVFYQNPVPAAGVLLVENDAVLLVRRAHPPKIDWWCIPAGFMEWHEHPRDTAIRELKEETGLEIELTEFFEVYSGNDDPRTNAVLLLYLGRRVGGEMTASDDASEVRFFPFEALPREIAFEAHRQALRDYDRRFRK
ncbi:MAG: NUDIX hydrolase [Candidatus Zixiibacteriota bacterium]|nr:MAG: NUDIX hydrolase [candidate division Zixibacteria bacterium]